MTKRILSTPFSSHTRTFICVAVAFGLGCAFMSSANHGSTARATTAAVATADEDGSPSASAFGLDAMKIMSDGAFGTPGTASQVDVLPACSATADDDGQGGLFHFMLGALKIMADGAFGHHPATAEGDAKPCAKNERKGLFGFMLNALGVMSDATFGDQRAPVELATPAVTIPTVAPRIRSNCRTAITMHMYPDGISRQQYTTTCE